MFKRNLVLLLGNIFLVLLTACSTVSVNQSVNTLSVVHSTVATTVYDWDSDIFHPIVGQHGMVVTEQKLASQIGLAILEKGGNAVDAAVAIGFGLAVALPNAGNVGGGGFMLVYDAKTKLFTALDFRETAPAAIRRDEYLDAANNVIAGK